MTDGEKSYMMVVGIRTASSIKSQEVTAWIFRTGLLSERRSNVTIFHRANKAANESLAVPVRDSLHGYGQFLPPA